MAGLISLAASPSVLDGTSLDDLLVRVCTPARGSEVMRLPGPKCSIGGDERCTLRLDDAGVQPMHCLILRGERGMMVRCCHPDTRLNGRSFQDARLMAGDRLMIGPVELEVMGLADGLSEKSESRPATIVPAEPPAAATVGSGAADSDRQETAQFSRQMRRLNRQTAQLQRESRQLGQREALLRVRCERLEAERTEFENERQQFDSSRQAQRLHLADESAALQRHWDELRSAQGALREQQLCWEREAAQLRLAVARQSDELTRKGTELQSQHEILERMRRERQQIQANIEEPGEQAADGPTTAPATLRSDVADLEQRYTQTTSELAALRSLLETLRADADSRQRQEESRLAHETAALERTRQKLEAQLADMAATRAGWEADMAAERVLLAQRAAQIEAQTKELAIERNTLLTLGEAHAARRDAERQEIEQQRSELAQQNAALSAERARSNAAQSALEAEQGRLHAMQTELEAQRARLTDAQATLGNGLAGLEAARSSVAAERREWDEMVAVESAEWKRRAAELATQQQAMHDQGRGEQTEQTQLVAELSIARQRLAEVERQLAEAVAERERWQTRQTEVEAEWAARQVEWQHRQSQAAADRALLEESRQQLEQAQVEQARQLAEQVATVEQLRAELAIRPTAAASEALPAETGADMSRFAERHAELDQLALELHGEQQRYAAQRAQAAAEIEERVAAVAHNEARLEAERDALASDRAQWERQRQRQIEELAAESDRVRMAQEELAAKDQRMHGERESHSAETFAGSRETAEETGDTSIHGGEPTSSRFDDDASDDDVFARLRNLSLLKNENDDSSEVHETGDVHSHVRAESHADRRSHQEEDEPADAYGETSQQDVRHADDADDDEAYERAQTAKDEQLARETEPVEEEAAEYAPSREKAPQSDDDEESIEDYMARLLNRMRGGPGTKSASESDSKGPVSTSDTKKSNTPAAASQAPPPAPTPTPAPAPAVVSVPVAAPVIQPAPAPLPRMTELGPRNAPPEVVDLAAMREIANSQARAAIHTHRHKASRNHAMSKWILSGTALVVTLGALWWIPADKAAMRTGLIAGVVISIYWGWQAVAATRRVLRMKESQAKALSGGGASSSR